MKSSTLWLAMLLGVVLIACGDDDPSGSSCQGSPPAGCEEAVGSADECPRLDDVCNGVCGASYDCCYCGDDDQWQTLYLDCPQCGDAGIDAL